MFKKTSYKKLYLTILKIGQEKINEGLSYNELKKILTKEGYDFENDCIELAVKQWFYDSFHHISADKELKNIADLNEHLDCNFILKGESCLKILSYKTSRYSFRNGIIALSLSLIAISYTVYHNIKKDESEKKELTEKLIEVKVELAKNESKKTELTEKLIEMKVELTKMKVELSALKKNSR